MSRPWIYKGQCYKDNADFLVFIGMTFQLRPALQLFMVKVFCIEF